MSVNIASAPVAYSLTTAATGTALQLFQVSSTGVTAGLTAGNFYLDSPPSNVLNGRMFEINATGWVKAHGATQKMVFGLQCFPWNTSVSGAKTATGTSCFTVASPSATLTAGTYYNFAIQQKFFGDANTNLLSVLTPTCWFAGAVETGVAVSSITVAYNTALQTEPITGINASNDYPLASFGVEFYNTVSDTTETMQLTNFSLTLI